MLCSRILNGVVAGLRPLSLRPGRDFDVVAISINPTETPAEAADKQAFYSRRYSPYEGSAGWHFLVGDEPAISAVTEAAGFHYRYDPITRMFVHASGIMVLTPAGKMARYFYGVEYEPKDLKLGLIEASGNRIGSPADQILLFCYHYDPTTGKYGAAVLNLCAGRGRPVSGGSPDSLWRCYSGGNCVWDGMCFGGFHTHRSPVFPECRFRRGREYDWLFWSLVVVCGAVSSGIACFVVYCGTPLPPAHENELPPQSTAVCDWKFRGAPSRWSSSWAFLAGALRCISISSGRRATRTDVYVIAKQWMWKIQYLDGRREINELHVPVGAPIKLIMTSQDVIHSFFVPAFRVKQDVLAEPLHHHLVPTLQAGEISPVLRRILRHQTFRNDRLGLRDGPPAVSAVACSRSGGRVARVHRREKLFHQFGCANCHHFDGHGPCPEPQGLYRPPGPAIRTASGHRRRILHPRIDRRSESQDRGGFRQCDAHLRRPVTAKIRSSP